MQWKWYSTITTWTYTSVVQHGWLVCMRYSPSCTSMCWEVFLLFLLFHKPTRWELFAVWLWPGHVSIDVLRLILWISPPLGDPQTLTGFGYLTETLDVLNPKRRYWWMMMPLLIACTGWQPNRVLSANQTISNHMVASRNEGTPSYHLF